MPAVEERPAHPLRELAGVFLRLGVTAFGGPAAHIAMMDAEVVRRRGWLTHEELVDLIGATNLIPGPNSTELAIHIGHRRAGFPGLVVAGACFIVPAALITLAVAWAYVNLGATVKLPWLLYGVKPVVVAIVAQALWGLGRVALKSKLLVAVAIVAVASSFAGAGELAILFAAGAFVAVWRRATEGRPPPAMVVALPALPLASAAVPAAVTLGSLFFTFVKIGSVLFGSGYVLLAFLRADLVDARHWITEAQLLDAVAVGQITPGPVFTTATFLGYLIARSPGALVATLGIFLPAFVFVALSGPLVPRIRASKVAGAVLDGVNAASLALMAAVSFHLARAAIVDGPTALVGLASAVLLVRFRVNTTWLIIAGAAAGFLIQRLAS
jgi:chromate transporter